MSFSVLLLLILFVGIAVGKKEFVLKKDGDVILDHLPHEKDEIELFKEIWENTPAKNTKFLIDYCGKGAGNCHQLGSRAKSKVKEELANLQQNTVQSITISGVEYQPDNSQKPRFSVKSATTKGICLVFKVIGDTDQHCA